jgi:hypothetical membrane protein
MTTGLVALGFCHVVTAYGLRRPLLGLGGLATVLVGLAPQPVHGSSDAHIAFAAVALVALSIWPLQDGRRGRIAGAVLIALLISFGAALYTDTAVGLLERMLTVAQALWPIAAVRALRWT